MHTTIHKSLAYDQLPKSNMIKVKEGDSISLVTYKLPSDDHYDCDYIYLHERLGIVKEIRTDGSFIANMESISGNNQRDYDFTLERLNNVRFGKLAHVLYKLNN